MDMKDLSGLTAEELLDKERQLRQELFNLRFHLATGRIENPMRIRHTRRDIARVKTAMSLQRQRKGQGS